MSQRTSGIANPEEDELTKKKNELLDLELSLADQELKLAELRRQLSAFERRYVRIVGKLYAELDEIEARIAELIARTDSSNAKAQHAATEARDQASASRAAVDKNLATKDRERDASPSPALKSLYREVAKRIHPDLASESSDRARRERLMAEANAAYEAGDEKRLRAILEEYEMSPDSVTGDGTAVELVRAIRKIAQVRRRLAQIGEEIKLLRESELSELKAKVDRAEVEGWDLLQEMAEDLKAQISASEERLRKVGR
ncbi:MAG TPA: molecular chaperone DnaJ [Candidatus Dormibacteraeota bacterium]|nr:molecular chaperone DnaJ [Candidatus Dormibacteraeota bacterium]